jgi:hypothetical protein
MGVTVWQCLGSVEVLTSAQVQFHESQYARVTLLANSVAAVEPASPMKQYLHPLIRAGKDTARLNEVLPNPRLDLTRRAVLS